MILSIDFDYFIREKILWDFGHSEEQPGLFGDVVWQIRYGNVDLCLNSVSVFVNGLMVGNVSLLH